MNLPVPPPSAPRRGFSLIEMLVVMAIIVVLAALTMSGFGVIKKKSRLARVQGELARIESAIENYKQELGFYPPDNGLTRPPGTQTDLTAPWHAAAPLFYELSGTVINGPNYQTAEGNEVIHTNLIMTYFGRAGFANTAADAKQVKSFLPALKDNAYKEAFQGDDVELLVAPVEGPELADLNPPKWKVPPDRVNPWRYASTKPLHRKGEFDLWADVLIGGKLYRVSNWAEPAEVK